MAEVRPNELLSLDEDGDLVVIELDADGAEEGRRDVTAVEALEAINALIAVYGPDHVPALAPGADDPAASAERAEVQAMLLATAERLWREVDRDETRFAEAVRRAVTSPVAIRLIAEAEGSAAETVRLIWPDLDALLGGRPDPGADPATDVVEGDERQGPGPLPDPRAGDLPRVLAGGGAVRADAAATDAARAGDPVLPFSGQLLIECVDLEMEGVGLDLRWERTYLHDTLYDGPLGPRWDHSYNLWVREAVEPAPGGGWAHVVHRSGGRLSAERFAATTGHATPPGDLATIADEVFLPGPGGDDVLEKRAGRFVCTSPDGREVRYGDHNRAVALRDANGNEVRLNWEGDPPRLVRVTDSCGRSIAVESDDAGRIVRVHDRSIDRWVRYAYDVDGRLAGVWRSVAPGAPEEPVQSYRYRGDGAPPGMEGNVVAVADGRGVEILQVDYGEEPGLLAYNRVVEQRDGGVTRWRYEHAREHDPADPDDPLAVGVVRVECELPSGDRQELLYNLQGRLIALRRRVWTPGGEAAAVAEWRYNADGRVVTERRPDGGVTLYRYGRELHAATGADPDAAPPGERRRFGELRRVVELAAPGLPSPYPTRVTEYDWHPVHGLLAERRGPFWGDHQSRRVDPDPPFAVRLEYDDRGNLTAIRQPDCRRPDASVQGGLGVTFAVDGRGRTTRAEVALEDGGTLATAWEYPPDSDPACAHPAVEVLDPDGDALRRTFDVDPAGRVTRIAEPWGLETRRVHDHAGRLLREEERAPGEPDAAVVEYAWGKHGDPVAQRRTRLGPDGREEPWAALVEEVEIDAEGDPVARRLHSADGVIDRVVTLVRGPDRRVAEAIADGVTTRYLHDARGLVVAHEVVAPGIAALRTTVERDLAGRPTAVTGPDGRVERLQYDGFGRVARRIMPGGTVEELEWDEADRPTRRLATGAHPDHPTPVRLAEDRRAYDACGRLVRIERAIIDPANGGPDRWEVTKFAYDRADRVVAVHEPDGTVSAIARDAHGRVVRADDGAGTVVTTTYDDATLTATHETTLTGIAADGSTRTLVFAETERRNARGVVMEHTDGLGNATRMEVDSEGAVRAVTDPAGRRSEASVDAEGAVRAVAVGVGTRDECRWSVELDPAGRPVGLVGPRGRVMEIARDVLGRPHRLRVGPDPDREVTQIRYDDAGRLVDARGATGIAVRREHGPDGLIRRVRVDRSGLSGPTARGSAPAAVTFAHDGLGRTVRADDGVRPVERRYDSRGLLVREAVDGRVVTWDHDDAGRPIACHLPGGTSVLYDRGPDGAPTGVRLETAGAGPVEVIRTWPAGLAPAEERWRGVLLRRERRDPAGRLTRLEESAAGTGPALLVTQVPDVRGLPATRRIELGGAGATETFSLDGQGRLARVAWEAPAEELVLVREPDGPLHSVRRRRAGAPDVTTGFLSRPSGPAVPAGTARADDADGLPMRLGDLDLEHDAHGRLVRVSSGGAEIAVIARDALGRVARLSWPGDAVDLIYDGRRPVLLRNAAGGETILVREPGGRLVEALTAAGPLRPLLDAEGSALGLADASGAPVATVGREPFGAARVVAGAWPPLLDSYHGMLPLPGTGLMLTPVRAYDPASGAFLSPDPAFPADGLDRYTYARGNPLGWVDPVGLMAVPAGATGRATSPGRAGGVALRRELSALDQAKLFYVGAAGAVLNLLLEPFLQVLDLTGGLVSAGFNLGGAEIDYRPMSGIGRMAAGGMGTGDILASMVTGIVETPGRVLDAIDRGDAHALGAESVNLVLLARGGAGVARGAGAFVFNRGVAAVGRLGSRGAQVQTRIRTWQVRRLERTAAATLPEEMGAANRPSVRYWANLEAYGRYQGNVRGTAPGAGSITIGEQAFTPSSIELLRAARTIFVEGGRRGYPQAAEIALHSLRGNLALRTVVHEMHHARQHWYRGQPSSGHGGDLLSQLLLETEFTQPGTSPTLSLIGAWNRELVVPPSPVWRGPTSLLGLLWAQPADGG